MPTITRRIRYACNTCLREIDLQENVYGVDVASRCIITSGCRGKLYRVPIVRDKSPKERPANVEGLDNWSQRKVLYTHQQAIQSVQWRVQHNLGVQPVVQVFVNRFISSTQTELVELNIDQYIVTTIDSNNLLITFSTAESGLAQCVTLTSSRNLPVQNPPITTVPTIRVSNSSVLTLATRRTDPTITFDLVFDNTDGTIVTYSNVDDSPTIVSPWVTANKVFINGKTYTVRSFNVVAYDATVQSAFNSGLVLSNTSFYFDFGSGYNIAEENLLLLAQSPYAVADRIFDRMIDLNNISTADPQLVFQNAEVVTAATTPTVVFPYIKAVR